MKKIILSILWIMILGSLYVGISGRRGLVKNRGKMIDLSSIKKLSDLEEEVDYRFILKNIETYEVFISYLKKSVKTKEEKWFLEYMERQEKVVFLD